MAGHVREVWAKLGSPFRAENAAQVPVSLGASVGMIALTAAALGVVLGGCVPGAWALLAAWVPGGLEAPAYAPLAMYGVAWSVFHLLEFVVTAYWNPTHLQADCTSRH